MDIKKFLDPEVAQSADSFPPILQEITRDNLERALLGKQGSIPDPRSGEQDDLISKNIISIPGRDNDIDLHIFRQKDLSPNRPVFIWLHGGGYIMGKVEDQFVEYYARNCDCTIVSVNYRIAPEHPFPAGTHDSYDALLWIHENADEIDVDPNRISIGGVSAGAGMAAGVSLLNRDQNGPALTFQFLQYPMLDNLHDTPSGRTDGHVLWNRTSSINAWDMYLDGKPAENASAYAAATRATDLSKLPPTYICVGGQDLFRDECIAYAQRLMQANVPTELGVFPGLYHGAEMFVPEAQTSQRMQQSMLTALRNGLGV